MKKWEFQIVLFVISTFTPIFSPPPHADPDGRRDCVLRGEDWALKKRYSEAAGW